MPKFKQGGDLEAFELFLWCKIALFQEDSNNLRFILANWQRVKVVKSLLERSSFYCLIFLETPLALD